MLFKRLKGLNVVLSFLILSTQAYATDLTGDIYLSKPSITPSVIVSTPSNQDRNFVPTNPNHFSSSVVDQELDRMEALLHHSKVASDEAVGLSQSVAPPSVKAKTAVVNEQATIRTVLIEDIINSSPMRPGIRLDYNTSIIIQLKDVQRFLVMDEGFIRVEKVDRDHVRLDALKYGGTFLNLWDNNGRRTIYVGIVFPETPDSQHKDIQDQVEEHEHPFRFLYSNDWNTYYFGAKGDDFKRQSYSFSQNFALRGQTPYGFLDTGMSTNDFDGRSDISSYTVGLSEIPVEGTNHLNVRGFDANRYQSPLTLSNTYLRGIFTDVDVLNDWVGLSYSYGQKRPYFAFLSQTSATSLDSYINAFKLSLNPTDPYNQLSLNVAEGFGSQHEPELTKKVYSIEARKKILNTYLNGEYAQGDDGHHASLAGIKYQQGIFTSALNFRQINKDFTTVSATPSNQGEIGTLWSTSIDNGRMTAETYLDIYRQYLYFNPNNPDALNYDFYGRLRVPLVKDFWSETNANYLHTPGETSPRRNVGLSERISKSINFLGFPNTSIYAGGALQKARYEFSSISAYDRYSVLSGMQVPLGQRLSVYANYDYSWVHEIFTQNDFNPSVFNTGLYYNRQLTNKLSGNFDWSYHKESGVKGTTSYLAGEDSAGMSLGFSYNPANDVNFFMDGRARKVWPQIEGNRPYNDLDIRLGLRMSFDVFKRGWDPYGTVSGHVYKDKNGDGQYNAKTDEGIKGVKVNVGHSQAVTNDQGYYRIKMNAKKVLVTPQTETVPSGAVLSTPIAQMATLRPWGASKVDFGFNSQTGVYGLIFVDQNKNGTPDAGDRFIKNIKILLDKKITAVSDTQGAFYFRNIPAGEHTLSIDINSLPITMIPQVKLENPIKVVEGTTYLFHVPLKVKNESSD